MNEEEKKLESLVNDLHALARNDNAIHKWILTAREQNFSNERLYLEIAVYQSKLLAERTAALVDASIKGYGSLVSIEPIHNIDKSQS